MSRAPRIGPKPEIKFMSYTELRAGIVNKMKDDGAEIKDCDLINRVLKLVDLHLPRSPGIPAKLDVLEDMMQLKVDIMSRHLQVCKNFSVHPPIPPIA